MDLVLKEIQSFGLEYTVFFRRNCHALIAWFELSRVKLYRNDLKGNKGYFDVAGGSSYGEFKLPRVKLQ